ncbi:IclR family transcriptional regulator [Flexivirga oryzae]|uniref:Glycerol operon regulatory protein n=1 Tax=Flexivirga oryzae TaxID=1794944 RepID=A0A839N499_9MICO|nr:IclR family transcriptional regulator [Flexivirga oryzae]MBB2890466.1 DNA-binding IclR family transcriptional regulator [Flexivirga oryzae]
MAEPTLIGSVQRALRLLEAVAASEDPVSAKSLARMVGLPLPTTYHLLRTLVHEGYLRKLTEGYALGPLAAITGGTAKQALLPRVRPVLKSLRDEVRGATYLSIYSEGEIRLVDIADGPDAPCVDLWVGIQDSGHATAFGKCILAALPTPERDDYIGRHQLYDLTPNTITDRRVLARSLEHPSEIWADSEEYLLGTSCLAAPIRSGDVVGAVAVSLPSRRPVDASHSAALRRAARRLGWAVAVS